MNLGDLVGSVLSFRGQPPQTGPPPVGSKITVDVEIGGERHTLTATISENQIDDMGVVTWRAEVDYVDEGFHSQLDTLE